jgi:biopolymer transport protein ExbD
MKFSSRKRRQAPTIIIISLIDILIVLLIFLMVTTTFKQQPALKLVLPESKQAKQTGAGDTAHNLIVTIAKAEPYFYLGRHAITAERLQQELRTSAAKDPEVNLSLQPDANAPWEQVLKAWDAAKLAGIRTIHVLTKPPSKS